MLKVPSSTVWDATKRFYYISYNKDRPNRDKKRTMKIFRKRKETIQRIGRIPNISKRNVANAVNISRETIGEIVKEFQGCQLYKLKLLEIPTVVNKNARLQKYIAAIKSTHSAANYYFQNFTVKLDYNPHSNLIRSIDNLSVSAIIKIWQQLQAITVWGENLFN